MSVIGSECHAETKVFSMAGSDEQGKGTSDAYSLGSLSASISYINRSIDQINSSVQDVNTKIDRLSSNFAKEMESVKVEMTKHTVELDTKVKFLIVGMSAGCSIIVSIITTLAARVFTAQ